MALFWAYVAGLLTLINPCVLPLLPFTIAAALSATRFGPLWLCVGLTMSFVVIGVAVTAFGFALGIDIEAINRIAATVMVAFGVVLLLPRAQALLSQWLAPVASGAARRIDGQGSGFGGQLFIGVLLGAVWSPCIGPTLGGAIALAASGEGLWWATLIMLMFAAGVSSVLLALSYGSREVLARRRTRLAQWMPYAKPVMGVALVAVGLIMLTHLNRPIEAWLLDHMPIWLQDLSISV